MAHTTPASSPAASVSALPHLVPGLLSPASSAKPLLAATPPAARHGKAKISRGADPRLFQISALALLMGWGLWRLDLEVRSVQAVVIVITALAVQAIATWRLQLPRLDLRSPLISALSLCLLLRTSSLALAALAAALAIGSKFLIRSRGKHVFNPSAFALVVLLAFAGDSVWVSGGQWGSAALALFAVGGIGHLVVRRAERSDVTWAFLIAYTVLLFGRATWLGDPWTIGWHQLCRGSLLIFAFFMISDPRTAPDSRAGRILWATLIAAGGLYVEHYLFHPNGPLWALIFAALLVPVIDRLLPGHRHHWRHSKPAPGSA